MNTSALATATLPSLAIVTPSFNQAAFLEDCLRSVLDQGYERLEYVVMDGGSTDGSVEILKRYDSKLTSWVSEQDRGQYDAISRGFSRTNGEIMAWLNSDDRYTPWAFSVVGEIFATHPEIEWLTTLHPLEWDAKGRAVWCEPPRGYSRTAFLRGEHLNQPGAFSLNHIQQESTFWRRSLWEKAGGHIDPDLRMAGDFELWARFFEHAELYAVTAPLGGFRFHGEQKTGDGGLRYLREAQEVLRRHGGRPHSFIGSALRSVTSRFADIPGSSLLNSIGLLHTCRICRYDRTGTRWITETRYV